MKKLGVITMIIAAALAAAVMPCYGAKETGENNGDMPQSGAIQDGEDTVDVIGRFCKCDSAVYEIDESEWKIIGNDTILTESGSSYVLINVVDSTPDGYRMRFKYLDVAVDTTLNSNDFKARIMAAYADRIIGTSFEFETTDMGGIIKFSNLGEVKKNARGMMKEISKEVKGLPYFNELKKNGLNLDDLLKNYDSDMIVDSYLNDVKVLFQLYGNAYTAGENTVIQDSPQLGEKVETIQTAYMDEDGCYGVSFDTETAIPDGLMAKVLEGMMSKLKKSQMKEGVVSGMKEAVEQLEKKDCYINRYLEYNFMPNGWPMNLLSKTTSSFGEEIRVRQKLIQVVDLNFYAIKE